MSDLQLWQRNLANLINSGLFVHAVMSETHGLFTVHGEYGNGTLSAPLAKYSDKRRAEDAVHCVNVAAGLVAHAV
jgi:hypothetical protein